MRPIDADALISAHKELCEVAWNKKAAPVSWAQAYEHFVDTLEDAPTIEAEPVKRGRWIFKHNPIDDPKAYFIRIVCSECNLHTGQKSNYCPNCGAKMDLEDE